MWNNLDTDDTQLIAQRLSKNTLDGEALRRRLAMSWVRSQAEPTPL
jgi:hypothetical protein